MEKIGEIIKIENGFLLHIGGEYSTRIKAFYAKNATELAEAIVAEAAREKLSPSGKQGVFSKQLEMFPDTYAANTSGSINIKGDPK